MASSPQGDVVGARFHLPIGPGTVAAIASGGANARLFQIGPFAFPVRVRNAWYAPTGADQAATVTGSYRRMDIVNGGTAGTLTTSTNRMATLGFTASAASLGAMAFVVDTTVTAPSGAVLYVSQSTVGGTDANGTVLVAGQLSIAFEII